MALVIGNANYVKGELQNPVNDARLISATLDSLQFEVIHKENIATQREMLDAIREFGAKRPNYDIGFIYYAGHGIQVGGQNYLLPTSEIFQEENDVVDYGISVQKFLRAMSSSAENVNILVLDACRDNPFENQWRGTRSLKGYGLAKVPAPTGSLIAFSTNSGETAADGDDENSLYSATLAQELLRSNTSIEQVFKNVRTEVLKQTNGAQRPVEESQLTGGILILVPLDYTKIIQSAQQMLKEDKYYEALEIITSVINDKNYIRSGAYMVRSDVYKKLGKYESSLWDIDRYIDLNRENDYSFTTSKGLITKELLIDAGYLRRGSLNHFFGHYRDAISDYSYIIENSTSEENIMTSFQQRGILYQEIASRYYNTPEYYREKEYLELAIKDYKRVVSGRYEADAYNNMASAYSDMGQYNLAIDAIEKAIEIRPGHHTYMMNRANKLANIGENKKALKQYNAVIDIMPEDAHAYYNRGYLYFKMNQYENALEDYEMVEKMTNERDLLKKLFFYRSKIFLERGDDLEAYLDLSKALEIDVEDHLAYKNRSLALMGLGRYEDAVSDLSKALDIAPYYIELYTVIGDCYLEIGDLDKAIISYEKAILDDIEKDIPPSFALENENDVLDRLVSFYKEASRLNEVVSFISRLDEERDRYKGAPLSLARVYCEMGDTVEAIRTLKNYLKAVPASFEANRDLGTLLLYTKDFENSMLYLQRADTINENDEQVRLSIGLLLFLRGDTELFDLKSAELAEDWPFWSLFQAYLYLQNVGKHPTYAKKTVDILKAYNLENGHNYVSDLMLYSVYRFLGNRIESEISISQALANCCSSFPDRDRNLMAMFNFRNKRMLDLHRIDIILERAGFYFEDNKDKGCSDLKMAIELVEKSDTMRSLYLEDFYFMGETKSLNEIKRTHGYCD